jgi:hypothetical protein
MRRVLYILPPDPLKRSVVIKSTSEPRVRAFHTREMEVSQLRRMSVVPVDSIRVWLWLTCATEIKDKSLIQLHIANRIPSLPSFDRNDCHAQLAR